MDIGFCVDNSSSMLCDFKTIRKMIVSVSGPMLQMQRNVRIGLVKFPSANGLLNTNVYGFTTDKTVLEQWLDSDEPSGGSSDGYEPIGDALNAILNIGWRTNIENQIVNKKLAILITDGTPKGLFTSLIGADPWIISNKFIEQDITLVVVGVGESIVECDDFYCALAEKTGGKYIPMVNSERIIVDVLKIVSKTGATFRQVFGDVIVGETEKNSSLEYSAMKSRVDGMINECETMADIKKLFFNRHSHYI